MANLVKGLERADSFSFFHLRKTKKKGEGAALNRREKREQRVRPWASLVG